MKGHQKESVEEAAVYMRRKQADILRCGAVSITMLFFGGMFQAIENLSDDLACAIIFLFAVGIYMFYQSTREAKYLLESDAYDDDNASFGKGITVDRKLSTMSTGSWKAMDTLRAMTGYESIRFKNP